MLVRPYLSLRVIFVSPSLCHSSLQHTNFIDHIGGPPDVRNNVLNTMAAGISITANVLWMANAVKQGQSSPEPLAASVARAASLSPTATRLRDVDYPWHQNTDGSCRNVTQSRSAGHVQTVNSFYRRQHYQPVVDRGEPCYIHCTPLLGSDSRVGVWMVLLVGDLASEHGTKASWRSPTPFYASRPPSTVQSEAESEDTMAPTARNASSRLHVPTQLSFSSTQGTSQKQSLQQPSQLHTQSGPSLPLTSPPHRAQNDAVELRQELSPLESGNDNQVPPSHRSSVGYGSTDLAAPCTVHDNGQSNCAATGHDIAGTGTVEQSVDKLQTHDWATDSRIEEEENVEDGTMDTPTAMIGTGPNDARSEAHDVDDDTDIQDSCA